MRAGAGGLRPHQYLGRCRRDAAEWRGAGRWRPYGVGGYTRAGGAAAAAACTGRRSRLAAGEAGRGQGLDQLRHRLQQRSRRWHAAAGAGPRQRGGGAGAVSRHRPVAGALRRQDQRRLRCVGVAAGRGSRATAAAASHPGPGFQRRAGGSGDSRRRCHRRIQLDHLGARRLDLPQRLRVRAGRRRQPAGGRQGRHPPHDADQFQGHLARGTRSPNCARSTATSRIIWSATAWRWR